MTKTDPARIAAHHATTSSTLAEDGSIRDSWYRIKSRVGGCTEWVTVSSLRVVLVVVHSSVYSVAPDDEWPNKCDIRCNRLLQVWTDKMHSTVWSTLNRKAWNAEVKYQQYADQKRSEKDNHIYRVLDCIRLMMYGVAAHSRIKG